MRTTSALARRAGNARMQAYTCHEALSHAIRRGAHPRRIDQLTRRALRAWDAAARIHARIRDWSWRRVALWHCAALRHGVLDTGAPVPDRLPLGIDEPWPDVPHGVQWLQRAGLPRYRCVVATLLNGTRLYPGNGSYHERIGGR